MSNRSNPHGGRNHYYIEGEGIRETILKLKRKGKGKVPQLYGAGYGGNSDEPQPTPDSEREFRFSRMFPDLPKFEPDDDALIELGRSMLDASLDSAGNTTIPGGMTYLGQFIDHDITLDLTDGLPTSALDPTQIENGRSPGLDLDSVYGTGPDDSDNPVAYDDDKIHLTLGQTTGRGIFDVTKSFPNDLPRHPQSSDPSSRVARIGDGRNDENLAVAQTHVAFLKFHNRIVDEFTSGLENPFEAARTMARQHYQSIVLHDFLPRLVDEGVLNDVFTNGRKFFLADGIGDQRPPMPVEFSVAAYRMGHSMVRNEYEWNHVFSSTGDGPIASMDLVFEFSQVSTHLGLFSEPTVPSDWIIRWTSFHDFSAIDGIDNHPQFNVVRKLDPALALKLDDLPEFQAQAQEHMRSLAARNLLRGKFLGLPTGQTVADEMGVAKLTEDEVRTGPHQAVIESHGFEASTPLWYYILKEAQVQQDGLRLGAVGSRLLVETFHALAEGSADSILSLDDWQPSIKSADPKKFTFADLLAFAFAGQPDSLDD